MQNGTFGLSQDISTRYIPIQVAFLTFLFLYLNVSIQSPDAKRAQIIVVVIIIIIINIIIIIIIVIIITTTTTIVNTKHRKNKTINTVSFFVENIVLKTSHLKH